MAILHINNCPLKGGVTRVKEQVKEGRSIQIDLPFNSFEIFLEEVYQKMETIGGRYLLSTLKTFRKQTIRKIVERATPGKKLAFIGHSQKN